MWGDLRTIKSLVFPARRDRADSFLPQISLVIHTTLRVGQTFGHHYRSPTLLTRSRCRTMVYTPDSWGLQADR